MDVMVGRSREAGVSRARSPGILDSKPRTLLLRHVLAMRRATSDQATPAAETSVLGPYHPQTRGLRHFTCKLALRQRLLSGVAARRGIRQAHVLEARRDSFVPAPSFEFDSLNMKSGWSRVVLALAVLMLIWYVWPLVLRMMLISPGATTLTTSDLFALARNDGPLRHGPPLLIAAIFWALLSFGSERSAPTPPPQLGLDELNQRLSELQTQNAELRERLVGEEREKNSIMSLASSLIGVFARKPKPKATGSAGGAHSTAARSRELDEESLKRQKAEADLTEAEAKFTHSIKAMGDDRDELQKRLEAAQAQAQAASRAAEESKSLLQEHDGLHQKLTREMDAAKREQDAARTAEAEATSKLDDAVTAFQKQQAISIALKSGLEAAELERDSVSRDLALMVGDASQNAIVAC